MLPSTENLINELPIPIQEVVKAALNYNSSYSSWSFTMDEHKLYFALKDIKEWLERPKYGESILSKFINTVFEFNRSENLKRMLEKFDRMMGDVKGLYDSPQLDSKQIPRGKPSKRHCDAAIEEMKNG